MWRFLHRNDLKSAGAIFGAAAACIVGVSLAGHAARALEQPVQEQLSRTGPANHAVIIREHAGWDRNCDAVAHPALYLDAPPRHGSVCARDEEIRIRTMAAGTEAQCIGRLVRGVRLVYRPDAGFSGDDVLQYAVQYPALRKTVAVSIAVTRDAVGGAGAFASMAAPALPVHQPPGPVPPCAETIF